MAAGEYRMSMIDCRRSSLTLTLPRRAAFPPCFGQRRPHRLLQNPPFPPPSLSRPRRRTDVTTMALQAAADEGRTDLANASTEFIPSAARHFGQMALVVWLDLVAVRWRSWR